MISYLLYEKMSVEDQNTQQEVLLVQQEKEIVEFENQSVKRSDSLKLMLQIKKEHEELTNKLIAKDSLSYILDLLTMLPIGSNYNTLQVHLPEIGPIKNAVGDGSTEAKIVISILGQQMRGEFNYHNNKLISHGFGARGLSKDIAQKLYNAVKLQMIRQHGKVDENSGPLEDGHPGYSWSIGWEKPYISFGVYMEKIYDGYQVGWGGQGNVH